MHKKYQYISTYIDVPYPRGTDYGIE